MTIAFVPKPAVRALFRNLPLLAALAMTSAGASTALNDVPLRQPVWSFATQGPVWGSPAVAGGVLYVGSDDGRVYAVDVKQRRQRWAQATGGPVRSTPLVAQGRVIVCSDDGFLHAFDAGSGKPLWKADLQGGDVKRLPPAADKADFDYMQSSPVLHGDVVFAGSASGKLFAVSLKDGSVKWSAATAGRIRATPLVHEGRVVVGSWDQRVYAFDAASGKPAWQFDTGGIVQSTAAAAAGKLVVGSRSAKLFALDPATGKVAWTQEAEQGSWIESSGVLHQGRMLLGSSDAFKLYALDPATGKQVWAFNTGGWAWAQPAVAKDTAYIGAVSASPYYMPNVQLRSGFYAVDVATGQARWRYEPPAIKGYVTGGVAAAPAVAGGMVYVPALDGRVYVFNAH
jgi:outer membrane protein assembly factor BamB